MKVILLAGGFGTRLSEYTENIPKPMIRVGDDPILIHIMRHYAEYGHKEFFLALGYKARVIKEFFLNYKELNSDFLIDMNKGNIKFYNSPKDNWVVSLIDTGIDTLTGGRLKRMKQYINNETFMLTYGDGVGNVNIDKLINYHKSHGKLVTMTAVRPAARFGELTIVDDKITSFKEKPQLEKGWINGGFFVMEPEFLDYIDDDNTMLERTPIEKATSEGQVMAYKHDKFWHCMDTKRDHELLEKLWSSGDRPWTKK